MTEVWEVISDPSCVSEGVERKHCQRCEHFETRPIPELGHDNGAWHTKQEPTCAAKGSQDLECTRCDHVLDTGEIAAIGHTFILWQKTSAATCTAAAIDTEKCSVCDTLGANTQEGHHALGHITGAIGGASAPTCEKDGYTGTGTCTRCSASLSREAIPKWGHHYHDWTAPTCTTAGNSERYCNNDCGTKEIRPTVYAVLGHENLTEAFAATCTTAGNPAAHGTCTRCHADITGTPVAALGHDNSGPAATCVTPQVCARADCNYQLAPINPAAHDWSNYSQTLAPTCTAIGKETRTCKHNAAHSETRDINALGHSFTQWQETSAPTCTTAAIDTEKCSRCPLLGTATKTGSAALGHSFSWTQTIPATVTTNG